MRSGLPITWPAIEASAWCRRESVWRVQAKALLYQMRGSILQRGRVRKIDAVVSR